MYNLTIGIPTYKRPEMLKKLIISIFDNNLDRSVINAINILVVDNDIDKTAQIVTKELQGRCALPYNLIYHHYPQKGLVNVRNEIFRSALELFPDYIVGIDDDEYTTTNWLMGLISTITTNKGEIVMGPVIPHIETNVPAAISYWFKTPTGINSQRINYFETGNFIIDTKFILKNNLRFDMMFNLTGAEDSYFGVKALKKGAKIYWAAQAIAYESISEKRASLKWLIRRSFRGALTFTYILVLEKKYLALLKKMMVNIIYIIVGTISLLLLPFPGRYKYWGIIKISESAGSFAGLTGMQYNEYRIDKKN